MATKTELKLEKGVRVAMRVGKNRWQAMKILAVVPEGYKVSSEVGSNIQIVPKDKAGNMTPFLDQKPPVDPLFDFDRATFEQLTMPLEVKFAKAPVGGKRVVYKAEDGVFYSGTVSGTSGNFTFVVLDSQELPSPVRVATESARIEPILDVKADTKATVALTEEQTQLLITPNYSKLVRALRALAEAEQSATTAELDALCSAVVSARATSGLPAASVSGVTLYTVVQQSIQTLKRTLKERSVPLKPSEFSLWDETPQATAHRLGTKTFGVVAEWRPPKGAVAVELGTMITEMLKNKLSIGKLNGRESAALTNLHSVYKQTKKHILSHAPDSAYISGILTANKQFLKHVRMMDIEHIADPGTGISYLRLFQISSVLDELGLA